MINIDHIDIVTSHKCNNNCPWYIDKFIHSDTREISLNDIHKFLKNMPANAGTEILLLGGEPTMLSVIKLIGLARIIKKYGYSPIMSTNGINKEKILAILPYYDWIRVTVYNDEQIDYWRPHKDKINIKLSGDSSLTIDKYYWFRNATKDFKRKSISMYFTPDWQELCTDEKMWDYISAADWQINGSYAYTFVDNIRFKKYLPNKTNVILEPTVPKLYPTGNYNCTWEHEEMDDYLHIFNSEKR